MRYRFLVFLSVILLLDGRPVSNENLERIPLPKGRTAVLRAEVRFPDGSSATAETLVGAPAQDAAQAELTALVVARTKKSAAEDPAQMAGFFRSGGKDVPDDGQRYAVIGWKQWSDLLALPEFASTDYVGEQDLPWRGSQAKRWLGTVWIPHSGLPQAGNIEFHPVGLITVAGAAP